MAKNTHPKMERAQRAKQFMPFDALKGLKEALARKELEFSGEILKEEKKESTYDILERKRRRE